MFTGLVQTTGIVSALESSGSETRMRIAPQKEFESLVLGESIAVNGVCLTVEDFGAGWFYVYASRQTKSVTTLGSLNSGHKVNLERALRIGDRLGGHLVSGHVDCLGRISALEKAGESVVYTVTFPRDYQNQVIDKGSVTLDGISLTVTNCGADYLRVNIIPATRKETTAIQWKVGSLVNMETDVIGKYVEKMLGAVMSDSSKAKPDSSITDDFLRKHGF